MYQSFYDSPLGKLLLQSDGENLTALKIQKHRFYHDYEKDSMIQKDDLEIFKETRDWLDRYFRKEKPGIK